MKTPRPRRIGSRVAAFAIALGLVFGAGGCGIGGIDWVKVLESIAENHKSKKKKHRSSDDDDDDEKKSSLVDLGTASFPSATRSPRRLHDWEARPLDPDEYALTYALSSDASKSVEQEHLDFARDVRFVDLGKGRFRWVPPAGCPKDMGCVFGVLSAESKKPLLPLVALFEKRKKDEKLNALELAELVVSFAQNIDYEVPKDPFGILAPALIVAEKRGDCDSKSLLAHVILQELGYDTLMLSSSAHAHSMLGIALPVPGHKMRFGGHEYAFTEMTAKGSPIGHVNRDLLEPDDWQAVPIVLPSGFDASAHEDPLEKKGTPRRDASPPHEEADTP